MSGIVRQQSFPLYAQPERGNLVSIEFDKHIPFPVKRTYYLWNVPVGKVRGAHAHTVEKEFFICIRGKCSLWVSLQGEEKQKILLNSADFGIFVDNMVWHEFSHFSPDAVLLCFSSVTYMPENYITNFEEFREVVKGG